MPRDHARVNVTIWNDPDFRALPPAAQHLYLTLWTSPDLTYCGVHDWRPGRLAHLSEGFTAEHLSTVASCLQARHFLVIDEETEEALVRSWARFDGLMKQPRMAVSLVNAYSAVASATVRAVAVNELHKIREEEPGLACWSDKRVAEVLDHPRVSAKDLPTPADPFGDGFGSGLALGLPQTQPKVYPWVYTPPTPAPAPAPKPSVVEGGVGGDDAAPTPSGRKRPSTPLPDDFEPNDANRRLAEERNLDLDAVVAHWRDHHLAKDSRFVDWQRALGTWIRREKPGPSQPAPREHRHVSEIEKPPDGLTDEQYAAWYRDRRRA